MGYLLYRILVYLALPIILIGLFFRGFRNKGYWQHWWQRLGFVPHDKAPYDYWLHAVSVGEVRAAVPVVKQLIQKHSLLLTVTTPTGRDMANMMLEQEFGENLQLSYLPYDIGCFVRNFFNRIQPGKGIVMETEVWPNLVKQANKNHIPLTYLNVRLSAKSLANYQRFANFSREIFNSIDLFAAQSQSDADHLQLLGISEDKISLTGSLKFDLEIPKDIQQRAADFRQTIAGDRLIWICGSTRDDEESILLGIFKQLQQQFPELLLIVIPRHPERFDQVADLINRAGLPVARRSNNDAITAETTVYLGDTMGELSLLYAASDIAFVGGSLKPLGGQNIIEPCALGIPVIFGPYMFNFKEVSQLVVQAGAGIQVTDQQGLQQLLTELLSDKDKRQQIGANGEALIEQNKGALKKVMQLI